jgi:hypothetical protein
VCITIVVLSILLVLTSFQTYRFYALKNNLRLQREFHKFIDTETKLIDVSKWIESEKAGRDLGEQFVSKWVLENAVEVRKAWNRSKCKKCKKVCRGELKVDCHNYQKENNVRRNIFGNGQSIQSC